MSQIDGLFIEPLTEKDAFGRVLRARHSSLDLVAWLKAHRAQLDTLILEHDVLLFSGFRQASAQRLSKVMRALGEDKLPYLNRSTPRTEVLSNVFTATEYPADQRIPLHCENAYQRSWPMRLVFHCVIPAETGGETTLADMRVVTQRVDADTLTRFREHGVRYERRFGSDIDIPWRTAFQTESRDDVDRYCADNGIDCSWIDADTLRTVQTCQGTARHPQTGEEFLFNQAHLFHISSLGVERSTLMLEAFGEEGLPRHVTYGDGASFPDDVLDGVRGVFEVATVPLSWQTGDIAIVDNMRIAHGRAPFTGRRVVLMAMSRPHSEAQQAAQA